MFFFSFIDDNMIDELDDNHSRNDFNACNIYKPYTVDFSHVYLCPYMTLIWNGLYFLLYN